MVLPFVRFAPSSGNPSIPPGKLPSLSGLTQDRCPLGHWLSYLTASISCQNNFLWDFSGGPGVKKLPCNVGDTGLIPGQGTKIVDAAG